MQRQGNPVSGTEKLLAGVELGGTKCVCILGTGPDEVLAQERLPTADPETTLARIEAVIAKWIAEYGSLAALGIASFGPLVLERAHPAYGSIASTPKPGWSHTQIAGRFAGRFGVPVAFDTDVNGAALSEGRWGAARGLHNFAYVTVGTGIGVGLVINGPRCSAAITRKWGTFASHAGRAIDGPVFARSMAIARKGWRAAPRSRRVPASPRSVSSPITRYGMTWRIRSDSSCTPWSSRPHRNASSWAAAS